MITPQVLNTLESICTINNTENRAFHKRKHKTVTDHIRFVCLHRIQEGTKKDSFSVVVVAAVVVPLSFVLLAECGGQSLCIRIRFCFENRMKIGLVSSRSGYFEVCIVLCVSSFFFCSPFKFTITYIPGTTFVLSTICRHMYACNASNIGKMQNGGGGKSFRKFRCYT